jgi:probable HAF family extracellular repeat protein
LGINARRQVVGLSCGASSCRAFLWEDGVMTDLNALLAGRAANLVTAGDINDAGVITGEAIDRATGERLAFVATPMRGRGTTASRSAPE